MPKLDVWLETTEFFELSVYTDVNTKSILSSGKAFAQDGDYKADYYSITNDSSIAGGDPDGIATSQNLNDVDAITNGDNAGATTLAIDGALGNSTSNLGGKVVTISSAGNDSTAKFTVTGTKANIDLNGDGDTTDPGEGAGAKREVIWGVNAGKAIGKLFETVTSITVDQGIAGNVTAGVSGGDLTINGAFNSGGTASWNSDSDGKIISITSAENDSSVKFTVVGTDMSDVLISETIFGGAQQTVTGSKIFKTVTKVTADKATDGNISVGAIGDGTDEGNDITLRLLEQTSTMSVVTQSI